MKQTILVLVGCAFGMAGLAILLDAVSPAFAQGGDCGYQYADVQFSCKNLNQNPVRLLEWLSWCVQQQDLYAG